MTAPAKRRRILLVEDEMLVAMSIEDALTDAGHEVVGPASTVESALELLTNEPRVDAIILDMNLNGKSGMPVADASSEKSIPFVVLSGYGTSAMNGAHADAPVLSKPFDSVHLLAVLREILERTECGRV